MDDNKVKIRAFLSKFIKVQQLNDDADIFALGFVNSLFAMQLVVWIEKEFNIEVVDEDLEIHNFNAVSAIAGFVERKSASAVMAGVL